MRRTLESAVERVSSRRESKACKIYRFKETSVLDLNSKRNAVLQDQEDWSV